MSDGGTGFDARLPRGLEGSTGGSGSTGGVSTSACNERAGVTLTGTLKVAFESGIMYTSKPRPTPTATRALPLMQARRARRPRALHSCARLARPRGVRGGNRGGSDGTF